MLDRPPHSTPGVGGVHWGEPCWCGACGAPASTARAPEGRQRVEVHVARVHAVSAHMQLVPLHVPEQQSVPVAQTSPATPHEQNVAPARVRHW